MGPSSVIELESKGRERNHSRGHASHCADFRCWRDSVLVTKHRARGCLTSTVIVLLSDSRDPKAPLRLREAFGSWPFSG